MAKTIAAIQAKLQEVEQENNISRRRVRDLERELELCKREVVNERSRVLQIEDTLAAGRQGPSDLRRNKGKGKERERTRDASFNDSRGDISLRYREVVEEKKGWHPLRILRFTHLNE